MNKKKNQKISFTIDMKEIVMNQRKFDTSEIGRGIGFQKAKKGKGSFTRKEKHKKNGLDNNNHSFFMCMLFQR